MRRWLPFLVAAAVVTAGSVAVPNAGAQTPIEAVARATAEALPDAETGWVPVDFVKHPLNPVHSFGAENDSQNIADRIFPAVMRVDDKLAAPLDGHRWYLWLWRHGLYPRTPTNGGRMQLLTADSLEGPWTDRGFVTPANMTPEGWLPYGWTGGDVVWSSRHQRFFSVPHASRHRQAPHPDYPPPGLDTFLMESRDGVTWQVSDVEQPVLPAGPDRYDNLETGYGKLLPLDGPGGSERWIWLYRAQRRGGYYTFAVATAGDIYGPWEKAAYNPVFDPFADGTFGSGGGLLGLNGLVCYQGYYQMLWQGFLGPQSLARSKDLRSWESFAPFAAGENNLFGRNNSVPVFLGGAPHEVVITGGDLVYDDTVGAYTFVYTAWDAQNLLAATGNAPPGQVSLNIARSLSGGTPPPSPTSDNPTELADACP